MPPTVNDAHLVIYPMFERLLIENSETGAIRAGHFLAIYMDLPERPVTEESLLPADLDKNAQSVVSELELVKLKVFSPIGKTVYSTDEAGIGRINANDYFHEWVALGNPFSKVVRKLRPTMEGASYTADVVETYVPLMAANGEFRGAFEICYDATDLAQGRNEYSGRHHGRTADG